MEKVRSVLRAQRVSFDQHYNVLTTMLSDPKTDNIEMQSNLCLLDQKMEVITDLGNELFELLLEAGIVDDDGLNAVILAADYYSYKYHKLKLQADKFLHKDNAEEILSTQGSIQSSKRKLKLPTIEFKKFSGDIKEWLSFWSQFKQIHEDEDIETEDKFQYLIQATVPNSLARQVVDSYPPSEDNYPKVIDSLKNRFGRNDLLVEVYVRELLMLILTNLNSRMNLSFLYDKIEAQLQALDTLGVMSGTCAAMLYPLVESCIPEELIKMWQKSSFYDSDFTLKIDKLMMFLRKEVEREERQKEKASEKKIEVFQKDESIPTAPNLINKSFKECVFCKGQHSNENCVEAKKWTSLWSSSGAEKEINRNRLLSLVY